MALKTVQELIDHLILHYQDRDEKIIASLYGVANLESYDLAEEIDTETAWDTIGPQLDYYINEISVRQIRNALDDYVMEYVDEFDKQYWEREALDREQDNL